jgi:hypothetical protein
MQLLRGKCIAHKEAPGVVVLYTDPAAEDEGDLDSLRTGITVPARWRKTSGITAATSKTATGSAEITPAN